MPIDPEILRDFLTESGELLEQFDRDLVLLERNPDDEELVNRAFRALHTIKGNASFLSLEETVRVAHASEEALNAARKGRARVDRAAMDHLLAAADVIRRQLDQLSRGAQVERAGENLLAALAALGRGAPGTTPGTTPGSTPGSTPGAAPGLSPACAESCAPSGAAPDVLTLPSHKADLLEFMASDLEEGLERVETILERWGRAEDRADASADLMEAARALERTAEFFELPSMAELSSAMSLVGERLACADEAVASQTLPRLRSALRVLRDLGAGLAERRVRRWEQSGLVRALRALSRGLGGVVELASGCGVEEAMLADGVRPAGSASGPTLTPAPSPLIEASAPPSAGSSAECGGEAGRPSEGETKAGGGEASTIRVDVRRLESLLDLVGELVLQKNRLASAARRACASTGLSAELRGALTESCEDLDRVTGDLQLAVMRTRMQPLDKVFGRYPRLIRDLERATGKSLRLEIVGGETEVDKTVIELIGDPLVHVLRNSADHGIERPEARRAAGKREAGTIRLSAQHAGDHVLIEVSDDGAGLSREKILGRAVERGLVTREAGAALSDGEVYRFIFAPGFSTAESVSDLSGRGVGMDVVNSNIQRMKGSVSLRSEAGKGTTVSIAIPLTLAILDAMIVGVGDEEYAIPLTSVVEIVKPRREQVETILGARVMRLRDMVLPLVDGREAFGGEGAEGEVDAPFAVVLSHDGQRAGLLVTRLVGQREIVVKALEGGLAQGSAVSGVTIGENGEASLIVDVSRLLACGAASRGAGRGAVKARAA